MPKQKDVERQLQGRGYISEMEGRELCNDCGKYYNNCVDNIRLLGKRVVNIENFKRFNRDCELLVTALKIKMCTE